MPQEVAGQGCVTGKPLEMGGIDGRTEATGGKRYTMLHISDMSLGKGVFFGLREVLETPDLMEKVGLSQGVDGKRIAVQGFGNGTTAHTGILSN